MTIHNLLIIQLVLDVALLVLIGAFFWYVGRSAKRDRTPSVAKEEVTALRDLVNESQRLSTQFVESLEEGRKTLKSLAFSLDEKERRLRDLVERAEDLLRRLDEKPDRPFPPAEDAYGEVLRLRAAGLSSQEIAGRLGLTAGEVELITRLRQGGDTKEGS
ncbi:MAG TPA: hypothetical protein PK836_02625 [Syntrophales bacterium]|nr:hypothetical protein [Syntrophales bacterium]HON99405.1 hypothetical protein [Syntrophales bacterium]HPC00558.1 hypothetical protein [Syntrophales bacterium]HPQ06429.1 hypothetical protein [Syntrophales bacterium]HRV42152.1 hypothetical protein [Syntrophales bacterium]